MGGISRRGLLASGSLGALSALEAATPAQAARRRKRKRRRKRARPADGSRTRRDPQRVWDKEADRVVAGIIQRGEVARVNALLGEWRTNSQPLPPGLPPDLAAFIGRARKLPAWTDDRKLRTAVEFNEKRGRYLGLLYGLASGMMSTAIPREARAVYYSKGGADMKDRIAKTAKLGYDIGTPNAYAPDGEMVVTCVKTRLVHAAVRHLLPRSKPWKEDAEERIPISQHDMMVTWHSLATTVMQHLNRWKIKIPPEESAAYLHLWQLSGYMLGIREEYIPKSWNEANAQARRMLTPVLGPTPEGIKLTGILLDLFREADAGLSRPFIESMTRYHLGDQYADWMRIPRRPGLDESIAAGWPAFIALREALVPLPLIPKAYWAYDEFWRQGMLLFLSEGKRIDISIPDANNPHYPSG